MKNFEGFVFVLILLLFCSGFSYSQNNKISNEKDWAGWRGLKLEGVSSSEELPIEWSQNKNVKWKTPIPGSGFSSPIISGESIFLTTSYQPKTGNQIKYIFSVLLCIINTIILCFLILTTNQKLKQLYDKTDFINLYLFSIIVLMIVLLGYFSVNVFDYQRCDSRKWVGSSLTVVMTSFSISFFIKPNVRYVKQFIGFFLLLFIWFFFYFMPTEAKEHLFRYGYFSKNPYFLYYLTLGYFILALLMIFHILPFKTNSKTKGSSLFFFRKSIFWISVVVAISLIITIAYLIIHNNEFLSYRFGNPVIEPDIGWKLFFLVSIIGVICIFLIRIIISKKLFSAKFPKFLRNLLIIFGFSTFVYTNYMTVNFDYSRAIISIDKNSGEINWISDGLFAPLGNINQNSPSTPTPISDGNKIYAYFGTAGLFCCDFKGNKIWENRNLPFKSYYGVGASLAICDDKIVVFSDAPKKSFLSILNKNTGKEVWKKNLIPCNLTHGSSRTPMIKKVKGIDVLFIWHWKSLILYNLHSGEEISNLEIKKSPGDLVVSLVSDSLNIYLADPKSCRAININKLVKGENPVLWDVKIKGPNIPSPILVNNLLFVINDWGELYCISKEKGEVLWKNRLPGKYYFSSAIANKSYIYLTDNNGLTTVINAAPKFKIIVNNNLNCNLRASLVPHQNEIFIRSFNKLYCIKKNEN